MRSLITSYFGIIVVGALVATPTARAQHGQVDLADITPYKAAYALTYGPNGPNSPFRKGSGHRTIEVTGSRCTEYRIINSWTGTMKSDRAHLKLGSKSITVENATGTKLAYSFTELINNSPR